MGILDINGNEIYVGADVDVPAPDKNDLWNFEFTGTVIKLDNGQGNCVVEDMDGDCWDVEPERLKLG